MLVEEGFWYIIVLFSDGCKKIIVKENVLKDSIERRLFDFLFYIVRIGLSYENVKFWVVVKVMVSCWEI